MEFLYCDNLGFWALGSLGPTFYKKWIILLFLNIWKASASKRILANHLRYKVYWTLKFHFLYWWGAMLKSGSLRHVTSRDTRFILVHDNRTPIGSKLPIMGEFFLYISYYFGTYKDEYFTKISIFILTVFSRGSLLWNWRYPRHFFLRDLSTFRRFCNLPGGGG